MDVGIGVRLDRIIVGDDVVFGGISVLILITVIGIAGIVDRVVVVGADNAVAGCGRGRVRAVDGVAFRAIDAGMGDVVDLFQGPGIVPA